MGYYDACDDFTEGTLCTDFQRYPLSALADTSFEAHVR